MPMFIFFQRSISFDLLVDMVWHGDLHSRSYSILSFVLIMHQDHTAFALLLFTAFCRFLVLPGRRFPVLGITNEKRHLMGKTLVDSSTM